MTPTWTLRYVALFVLLQLVALALSVVLLPLVALVAFMRLWRVGADRMMHWEGSATILPLWLIDNNQDGIIQPGKTLTSWNAFYWCGIRNSVHNFSYLRGVYGPGRPLWYCTWTAFGKQWYVKMGWMSNGLMACSAGAGRGY